MVGALAVGAGAPSGPCCPLRGLGRQDKVPWGSKGDAQQGDAAQRGTGGSWQWLEGVGAAGAGPGIHRPALSRSSAVGFPPVGSSARILCASTRVSPFPSLAGCHKEGCSVTLPWWLGLCWLGRDPPVRWDCWPDCLTFPAEAERRGRPPWRSASTHPWLIPARGGSPRWFFLLQMQSRAAAPGQALAQTRRTANPSR